MPRPSKKRSRPLLGLLFRIVGLLALVAVVWTLYVVHEINVTAHQDEARPADAIAVFGAAEYRGRPSPVYHARLDHAVALWQRQIAPLVITLGGGSDKDDGETEGGVGRDYLLANGIPPDAILAETNSFDTSQQVARLAEIAETHHLEHVVVVSDPTHLFRIQVLCQDAGLDAYTSPRSPLGNIDNLDLAQRYAHEVVAYTALRLPFLETILHRWVEGHADD